MKKVRAVIMTVLAAAALTGATAAHAELLTGNPAADGWTDLGNSLQTGTWVNNSGDDGTDISFDLYRTEFTYNGDTYLGLGGVVIGDVQNSDLEAVIKFGASSATWQAASSVGASDGVGGDAPGGNGMVLARISAVSGNPAGFYQWNGNPSGSYTSILSNASSLLQYAYVSQPGTYVQDYGSFPTLPTTRLSSFEAVLDLTQVQALYGISPSEDGLGMISMQGNYPGNYHYNDALAGPVVPVPLPASAGVGFFLLGAFGVAAVVRSRMGRLYH